MNKIYYNPKLKELARQLRNKSAKSEIKQWRPLKGKQSAILGKKSEIASGLRPFAMTAYEKCFCHCERSEAISFLATICFIKIASLLRSSQ